LGGAPDFIGRKNQSLQLTKKPAEKKKKKEVVNTTP